MYLRAISRITLVLLLFSFIVLASATKCDFCDREFKCLMRHRWRCLSRITSSAPPRQHSPRDHYVPPSNGPSAKPSAGLASAGLETTTALDPALESCICGRRCKGRRGLAAHQRACRVYRDLLLNSYSTHPSDIPDDTSTSGAPSIPILLHC